VSEPLQKRVVHVCLRACTRGAVCAPVQFVATQSGPGRDVELPVEVVVGTVPLRKQEHSTPMLTVKAAKRRLSTTPAGEVNLSPSPALDKRKHSADPAIPE